MTAHDQNGILPIQTNLYYLKTKPTNVNKETPNFSVNKFVPTFLLFMQLHQYV